MDFTTFYGLSGVIRMPAEGRKQFSGIQVVVVVVVVALALSISVQSARRYFTVNF